MLGHNSIQDYREERQGWILVHNYLETLGQDVVKSRLKVLLVGGLGGGWF